MGIEDKPRGWFNVGEYKQITKVAKRLTGKRVEWRAHSEEPRAPTSVSLVASWDPLIG